MPFGNAWFPTPDSVCGSINETGYPWSGGWEGYSSDKRTCFEQKCGADAQDPPDDCYQSKQAPTPFCQHGELECLVNAIGACAKHITDGDWTRYGPVVTCLEDYYEKLSAKRDDAAIQAAVQACTSKWTLPDKDKLMGCYQDDMQSGEQLQAAAKETPVHPGVPYVRLKNKDGNWEELSFGDVGDDVLLKKICAAWKYNNGAASATACAGLGGASEAFLMM